MKIVLISGLSGSGKSVALNLLEDHGFYCVDNLPLELIPDLVRYHSAGCLQTRQLGISLDIRSRPNTDTAVRLIERLRADGHEVEVFGSGQRRPAAPLCRNAPQPPFGA